MYEVYENVLDNAKIRVDICICKFFRLLVLNALNIKRNVDQWYLDVDDLVADSFYSGSMEPAFHRGDLLFLTNYQDEPVRVGEIVVFKVEGRDIPIVHRVLKLHEK